MEALQHAWPDLVLIQVFACEIDPAKRSWIHSVVNAHRTALGQGLVCIFTDISSLGSDAARCHTHGRLCRVPGCDVLVVGTSCKDLSKMTSNKFKHPVLSMQTSPGGTATTFRGLLTYLDSHSVDVVIYENSDNLDPQGGQGDQPATASNLDIFQSEMVARRFEGQNMLLNAKQFGSTASRRRFWSALFKTGGPHSSLEFGDRTLADIFSTFRALLKVCQRTPPTLEKVLLKSDDDVVERELLRRTALGKSDSSFSWIAEHQRLYANLRLQWGAPSPHIATSSSRWFKTLSPYHKSVLVYRQHKFLASSRNGDARPQEQCRELALSVDQSADRNTQSTRWEDGATIIAPCLLPGQLLWLHIPGDEERLLLGREALMLQGYPVCRGGQQADSVTERFLQDLAGHGMTLHVLLAVVQSAMAALSWKAGNSTQEPSLKEELDSAFALFSRVRT